MNVALANRRGHSGSIQWHRSALLVTNIASFKDAEALRVPGFSLMFFESSRFLPVGTVGESPASAIIPSLAMPPAAVRLVMQGFGQLTWAMVWLSLERSGAHSSLLTSRND